MRYGLSSSISCDRLIPRVRRVMSRTFVWNLSRAFGAMRRSLPSFAMLNPRNLRSSGRATALFASLTFSFSFVGQELTYRSHDPLPGAATANIDVAVVGVAAEAETPAGQFLVEIVEHEIAQEGRERTALRGALIHRTDQAVLHHPGLEKGPDKLEHAFVRHPRSDARHQA